MAILVDELREYPDTRLPFTRWCHMATDGPFEELHAFAARLGLRRVWFQADHYDLPPHGRERALALGAEPVTTGELLARMTGPRGDRARRRVLAPRGFALVSGAEGPRTLRYPAGDLVVVAGEPGAARGLAARAAGANGAVAVCAPGEVGRLAAEARADGRAAHLLLLAPGGDHAGFVLAPGGDHAGFASVTMLDPEAAARVGRIALG
jgi:hypothetical protein